MTSPVGSPLKVVSPSRPQRMTSRCRESSIALGHTETCMGAKRYGIKMACFMLDASVPSARNRHVAYFRIVLREDIAKTTQQAVIEADFPQSCGKLEHPGPPRVHTLPSYHGSPARLKESCPATSCKRHPVRRLEKRVAPYPSAAIGEQPAEGRQGGLHFQCFVYPACENAH